MSDDFHLLDESTLRDLADRCGRSHWRSEEPEPASTHFIQKSRVENYKVVVRLIQERSNIIDDERTRRAVWCSVCQAVDFELGEGGSGCERERAIGAMKVDGIANLEELLVTFVNHRQEGGEKTWDQWLRKG